MSRWVVLALVVPALAHADERRKPIYVRAGVAHVAPLESSRELELADVDGPASLAVQNGPIAGSGASVTSATVPALTIGVVLPWLDGKLSAETIVGLPFTVTFHATGTLETESIAPMALDSIPTGVPALGRDLGEATAIPIVVTAVYELKRFGPVTPYVGAGPAIMFTSGARVTNEVLTQVAEPEMSIDPAPGLVLQAGIDAKITKRVYARIDLKFIALMLARARVEHIQVRTPELPLFETTEVGTAKMDMWINPVILQAGVGTDF
jgi:outer membrane protein